MIVSVTFSRVGSGRVGVCEGVDAHLLRAIGHVEGEPVHVFSHSFVVVLDHFIPLATMYVWSSQAHKKAIRRASVNTFGYIAKAIGPQDVLHTLLNNLKVTLVTPCHHNIRCHSPLPLPCRCKSVRCVCVRRWPLRLWRRLARRSQCCRRS